MDNTLLTSCVTLHKSPPLSKPRFYVSRRPQGCSGYARLGLFAVLARRLCHLPHETLDRPPVFPEREAPCPDALSVSVLVKGQLRILSPWLLGFSRAWIKICCVCQYFSAPKNQALRVLPLGVGGSCQKAHRGDSIKRGRNSEDLHLVCLQPVPHTVNYRNHSFCRGMPWRQAGPETAHRKPSPGWGSGTRRLCLARSMF